MKHQHKTVTLQTAANKLNISPEANYMNIVTWHCLTMG